MLKIFVEHENYSSIKIKFRDSQQNKNKTVKTNKRQNDWKIK